MAAAAPINVPPYQELELKYDDLHQNHGSGEILLIPIDTNHPDAPFITVMFKQTKKNMSSIIKSSVGKEYTPYDSLVNQLNTKYKDYGGKYYASVLEKKDNIRSYKYWRQKNNGEIVYTILVYMHISIEPGNIVPHGAFRVNSTKIRELLQKSTSFVKLDDETIRRHIYFGKNNSTSEPGAGSAQIKTRNKSGNKSRKNSRKNLRNKSGKNSAANP
jgi:hypothetical protein